MGLRSAINQSRRPWPVRVCGPLTGQASRLIYQPYYHCGSSRPSSSKEGSSSFRSYASGTASSRFCSHSSRTSRLQPTARLPSAMGCGNSPAFLILQIVVLDSPTASVTSLGRKTSCFGFIVGSPPLGFCNSGMSDPMFTVTRICKNQPVIIQTTLRWSWCPYAAFPDIDSLNLPSGLSNTYRVMHLIPSLIRAIIINIYPNFSLMSSEICMPPDHNPHHQDPPPSRSPHG